MLAADWIHISAVASVLVIGVVLLATIAASALLGNGWRSGEAPKREPPQTASSSSGRPLVK
jgi:hypothetical protein